MKGKILRSWYDEKTHTSALVKQTKYGTFYGWVSCHDEDLDIANQWDAGLFCEYQCDLKSLKEKIKQMNQRVEGMLQVLDHIDSTKIEKEQYQEIINFVYSILRQVELDKEKYNYLKNNFDIFVEKTLEKRREYRKQQEEKKPAE